MNITFSAFLLSVALTAIPAADGGELVNTGQFRSVELNGGGHVSYVRGPVQRVLIRDGSTAYTRIRVVQDGKLEIDACVRNCPRHYRLNIEIMAPGVPDSAINGGGEIVAGQGFAPQSDIALAVNGGGTIDVRSLAASDASAAVHGGGLILTGPLNSLSAAVNGGGEIRYLGNPSVASAINGGGSIHRGR
jgi:hypothetical protein